MTKSLLRVNLQGKYLLVVTLALLAALALLWWTGPVQADADSTSFVPDTVALSSVGSSITVEVDTTNVDAGTDGVQINLQHSSDLEVSAAACGDLFTPGGSVIEPTPTTGGDLLGCFLLSGDINATTGNVMSFELTRIAPCTEEETVTFGVGGADGTQYSDGGTPIDPGEVNTLTVVCGASVSGQTTLQFRSSTAGLVTVSITDTDYSDTTVADDEGNWSFSGVPEDTYTVTASAPGYLSAELTGLQVQGADVALPPNELLGGDVNGNGSININDITGAAANFGKNSPQDWPGP